MSLIRCKNLGYDLFFGFTLMKTSLVSSEMREWKSGLREIPVVLSQLLLSEQIPIFSKLPDRLLQACAARHPILPLLVPERLLRQMLPLMTMGEDGMEFLLRQEHLRVFRLQLYVFFVPWGIKTKTLKNLLHENLWFTLEVGMTLSKFAKLLNRQSWKKMHTRFGLWT